MHSLKRGAALFLVLAAPVSFTIGDAHAQGAPGSQVGDIVITAQRREENVQRAALAVDVVSLGELGKLGVARASDLPRLVPSLSIGESGNGEQSLYLRSVGAFSAQAYSDPAISFNIDGVAVARPSSMTGVFYDLARVEVVKGPQGTLYGRNATGGAINVLPRQPELGKTKAGLMVGYGNFNQALSEGYVNLPIDTVSALRASFNYARRDGYQSDETGDQDSYAGRLQFLLEPNDDVRIRLAADYAHDGGNNAGGTLLGVLSPFTGAITQTNLSRDTGLSDPATGAFLSHQYSFISGRFLEPLSATPHLDADFWGVSAQIDWTLPIGTLTLIPAYRESEVDSVTTTFGFASGSAETDQQASFEARLASPNEGWLQWILGYYHFDEDIDAIYAFDQAALMPIQELKTGTKSDAVFARFTISPADRLRLTGGVRVTKDRKDFNGVSNIVLNVCTNPQPPVPACPTSPLLPLTLSLDDLIARMQFISVPGGVISTLPGAADSFFPLVTIPVNESEELTKTIFHVGASYDVGADSMLYVNWDTGYHAGGFAFARIKPTYEPEYVSAVSIGSKNRFFDRRVLFNVEAFYWRYKNQQIAHGATDIDGTFVFYTDNAGVSTIKGLDVEFEYRPSPGWQFGLNAQYLDASYDEFTYQTPAGGTNGPPVTACPFALTDPTHYTVDCAGFTPQQAPKWSGTANISKTITFDGYRLVGDLATRFQSSSVVGFELLPIQEQDSFTQSNAALTLAPDDDKWSITAFVNNIEDERPLGVSFFNSVSGTFASSLGAPRTYGVRAHVNF